MFFIIAIFLILPADRAAEHIPLHCFAPCQFGLNPICTTNGTAYKLFTNKCVLDTENCIDNTDWRKVDEKYCAEKPQKSIEDCNKNCDNHSAPTCNFDGNIYQLFWNTCQRLEKECIDGIKWKKVPLEKCKQDKICADVCPHNTYYICATNGEKFLWFKNNCFMELENCHLKEEDAAKRWRVVEDCRCMVRSTTVLKNRCELKCEPIYDPVCGIDGTTKKTFVNVCELTTFNCLNCKNYTVLHPKKC